MTNLSDCLNESAILHRFNAYLQQMNVNAALSTILDDAETEHFSNEEIELMAGEILIPEIVKLFAEKFSRLEESFEYDEEELPNIFETFCAFENLSDEFADMLATIINEAAARDEDESEDEGEPDDKDAVIRYWERLSNKERVAKVKAFLKKLAYAHNNMRDLKPFLKNLNVGAEADPYGTRRGKKVKTFDRKANNYGHETDEDGHREYQDDAGTRYWERLYKDQVVKTESTSLFPIQSHGGFTAANIPKDIDELQRAHPLHKTCLKHGFKYSHTNAVRQNNNSVIHHRTWSNNAGHSIGAYEGDTAWSAKVPSGHVTTGIGTVALEKHLKHKAKRYKFAESEHALPNLPILETLIDPNEHERVQRYARWMDAHPAQSFGHIIDDKGPAQELKEAWRVKEESDKKFGYGKDVSEYSLFDYRSGKPK